MHLRSLRARRAARFCSAVPLALVLAAVAGSVAPVAAQAPGAVDARPERSEEAFEAAKLLYDGGQFSAAERAFARFLDRSPRDPRAPEALFFRAESALAVDDDRAAAALFERFERLYPGHPYAARARLALGRYYYARGDDARAEDALAAAADAAGPPGPRAEAAYLLGLVHRRQDRPEAAVAAFERAAAEDTPSGAPALYALGEVHAEQGDWRRAADAFGRLQTRYPDSPEDTLAGLGLAEAFVRSGQLAEGAREADRRRATLAGDDAARGALLAGETWLRLGDADRADAASAAVPADSRYARRAALARGRVASARGDFSDAVAFYQTARAGTADGQDDAVAHEAAYYEGVALKALGQLGDAEARWVQATERRPDGAYAQAALLELGLLRYERRRYDEAAQAFDQLLALSPRGPYAGEAARMLGEAYAASGQTDRARDAFRRAEGLGTATAETRAEVAFQDAYALFVGGRYAEAVPALVAVANGDPTGPRAGEALFWAGESAFQAREYARAEAILRDLLDRYPDHPRADAARYVIAWTFYQRGQTAAAADAFERFLSAYTRSGELVPYYADALLRLGDLYSALGRYQDARLVYGRVAAATPDRQGGDYALFQTAQVLGREGQTDQALQAYGRLLREYPESERYAQALLAQGALYSARGQDSLAVAAYERVLRERPQRGAAALLGLGDVQMNNERYAQAETFYRRVFERYPSSPLTVDAFSGLADALDAQGRGDEVDRAFAEVDAGLGGREERQRLRYARALLALTSGQDSLAVSLLEEVLSGTPPADLEQDALLALGGAYASTGRSADAARALRRLLSRYPDGPLSDEATLRLAEALLASGDAEGARIAAGQLRTRGAASPERVADAYALEASALRTLGRADEADRLLRELVGRYPTTSAAQAALRDRPELEAPAPEPDDSDDNR
ncbi:tetratricopeptide repeat protein [Rubrivirga sp.]|uniref:tetratricopeptide repeat protein n=1 Tax=Rubrivirga sp. TaxID=1885344 RepID=UPI003B52B306